MKYGFRRPSLRGRISARTSLKRAAAHSLGVKMPRGLGSVRNRRKAVYNTIYRRTTIDSWRLLSGNPHRSRSAGSNDGLLAWLIFLVVFTIFLA